MPYSSEANSRWPGELPEQRRHLPVGKHRRQSLRPPGPGEVPEVQPLALEHIAVKEDQGIEGQVLGARRDLPVYRQVLQKGADMHVPQLLWV